MSNEAKMNELQLKLYNGVLNDRFKNTVSIDNSEYFAYGLEFLVNNSKRKLTKEELTNLPFNERTNSKYETITGFTSKQFKNFIQVCTDLNYIQTYHDYYTDKETEYHSNINQSDVSIIEKYGLIYKYEIDKLKTTESNAKKGLKFDKIEKENQKLKKLIDQIKNHTGKKLSKDEFVNRYLTLTKTSNNNFKPIDILNNSNASNTLSINDENDFYYKLKGNPELDTFYNENLFENLELKFETLEDLRKAVDGLYYIYKTECTTNEHGLIINPIIEYEIADSENNEFINDTDNDTEYVPITDIENTENPFDESRIKEQPQVNDIPIGYAINPDQGSDSNFTTTNDDILPTSELPKTEI